MACRRWTSGGGIPWSLGSYSFYPPGYQTTLLGIEKQPEGNIFFAGEHTWSQAGYLNAGVASGERAARQVMSSLAAVEQAERVQCDSG